MRLMPYAFPIAPPNSMQRFQRRSPPLKVYWELLQSYLVKNTRHVSLDVLNTFVSLIWRFILGKRKKSPSAGQDWNAVSSQKVTNKQRWMWRALMWFSNHLFSARICDGSHLEYRRKKLSIVLICDFYILAYVLSYHLTALSFDLRNMLEDPRSISIRTINWLFLLLF